MIDLYTWSTPNGRKVSIMLEEVGLKYKVHPIHIGKEEQFTADFLAINPNNKIPAIVDHDGPTAKPIVLFESGAILVYIAEKMDMLLPKQGELRYITLQWLMFQMGGVGPMLGQTHHFLHAAQEEIPYGIQRYANETKRLYGVMDKHLSKAPYLNTKDYSIADIATFPWIDRHEAHLVDLADYPNVQRWYQEIATRPAVTKGMSIPAI